MPWRYERANIALQWPKIAKTPLISKPPCCACSFFAVQCGGGGGGPPPVHAPRLEPPDGFVDGTEGGVKLLCATTGATIKYTLDGSEPTATHGATYEAPLQLHEAPGPGDVYLRAVAVLARDAADGGATSGLADVRFRVARPLVTLPDEIVRATLALGGLEPAALDAMGARDALASALRRAVGAADTTTRVVDVAAAAAAVIVKVAFEVVNAAGAATAVEITERLVGAGFAPALTDALAANECCSPSLRALAAACVRVDGAPAVAPLRHVTLDLGWGYGTEPPAGVGAGEFEAHDGEEAYDEEGEGEDNGEGVDYMDGSVLVFAQTRLVEVIGVCSART